MPRYFRCRSCKKRINVCPHCGDNIGAGMLVSAWKKRNKGKVLGQKMRRRQRNTDEFGANENLGQDWTTSELARITAHDRPSDKQLAHELGRSPTAIQVMRWRVRRRKA